MGSLATFVKDKQIAKRQTFEKELLREDVVEYYNVDSSKSVIKFDSSRGPRYQIDYHNKVILDCTSEGCCLKSLVIGIKCALHGSVGFLVSVRIRWCNTIENKHIALGERVTLKLCVH